MNDIAGISTEEIVRNAKETGFSGVISVGLPGKGAAVELAFGLADRGHRVPNDPQTRFAMASGCKIFAAVAVGLLIEEGKVALDSALADCVRSHDFHFGREVRIAHLLNHTAGIPDYFSEEAQSDFAALWQERPCYGMTSPKAFLPLFENGAMKASPGAEFLYSNSGFILLGLVVEELAGRDFAGFVAEHIFSPAGMTRSGYFAMDALPDNTALGYLLPGETEWRTNIFSVPSIGGSDGGAFTTVGDLHRFWRFLLAGRLLSPKMVERFFSPSVQVAERGTSWHYGYGVWLQQMPRGWIASIEGSDPGVSMESCVRLSDGLVVTVLSNVQDGAVTAAEMLRQRIAAG